MPKLSVLKDFGPDIIIIQLVSNYLMDTSDLAVGSHLEDLVTILHDLRNTLFASATS